MMKSLINFSLVLLFSVAFFHTSLLAQNQEKGTLIVNISTEIDAPADEVWEVLGKQFAEIEKWSSTINQSEAVLFDQVPNGFVASPNSKVAGRKTFSDKVDATEILVAYSDTDHTFTFVTAETPSFIVHGQNHTQVKMITANQSMVSFDIELQLKGFPRIFKSLFKKKLTKVMTQVQQDLKLYVEAGLSTR